MSTPASRPSRRRLAATALALLVAVSVAGAIEAPVTTGPSAAAEPTHASASENRTLVVAAVDPDEGTAGTDDRGTGSGERLLEVPVADGDEIALNYTHSVEKTPVSDVYVVDGADLRMDRTVFRSFGAGLPSTADATRTDEGFVVRVDRAFDRVYVSPGSIAGHELRVGDRCYDLVERSGGATVALFVEAEPPDGSDEPASEGSGPTSETTAPVDDPSESPDRRGECR